MMADVSAILSQLRKDNTQALLHANKFREKAEKVFNSDEQILALIDLEIANIYPYVFEANPRKFGDAKYFHYTVLDRKMNK